MNRLLLIIVLCLFACSTQFKQDPEIYYKVDAGDNLYSIADKFKISVRELSQLNNLKSNSKLKTGSILKISGVASDSTNSNIEGLKKVSLEPVREFIGKMEWPLSGTTKVSSVFNWRGRSFHEGIDLACPIGTPVYAAHAGKVVYAGSSFGAYGKLIAIKSNNLLTMYAHNSKILFEKGDEVEKGEQIAEAGMTGKATGPHLHFETRIRTPENEYQAVDPLAFYH